MRPKLYLTRRIPDAAIQRLSDVFEVEIYAGGGNVPRLELLEKVKDVEVLLCLLTDRIDRELMDGAPRLRCISNYAVGYNNIDLEYATQKGIAVCNTPGVLTETTADLAWALILSCARRIPESDRYVRDDKFTGWEPLLLLGNDTYGKTLGVIGIGRIGQAVARRSAGFNMKVIYYDPVADSSKLSPDWIGVSLDELCRKADFISIHTPLTAETQHLIGARELSLMKPSAILINTARGPIVDEPALIQALATKSIAGAGLDVYEQEPHIPKELTRLQNVVLLPHIGSASIETRTAMGMLAVENAIAVIEGRTPPSRVN